jgi:hypothetical protein
VNEAVGFKFWVLLSVIGLLLFCFNLPIIYGSLKLNRFQTVTEKLRRSTYIFFVVAFDEGALMVGILMANLLDASDKVSMLASKSFLFSVVGFFSILALAATNSVLWLLGESIFNGKDKSYSGVVSLMVAAPPRYAVPTYLVLTGIIVYLVVSQ